MTEIKKREILDIKEPRVMLKVNWDSLKVTHSNRELYYLMKNKATAQCSRH
jgi:hypothetical protein